jgi:hypothetical protein
VLTRLGVRPQVVGRIINLLREEAEEIYVTRITGVSPDPGDDPVYACAEHGRADFIATLNKKDFPQRRLSAPSTPHSPRPQEILTNQTAQLVWKPYCNIVTGVKSPANAMFEHTDPRNYLHVTCTPPPDAHLLVLPVP